MCSKTLLVELRYIGRPETLRCLCIVDEQSNASFCDKRIIEYFNAPAVLEDYSLSTLNGTIKVAGRSVSGLQVKGSVGNMFIDLTPLLTHPDLPDTSQEVATQDVVLAHPHIAKYSKYFPSSTTG